jgi:hypothetical protein
VQRPSQPDRRNSRPSGPRPAGRTTAVGPGDRRVGPPLIFGWGKHLTRAEKQKYRERFVLGAGIFVFALIVLVIGVGALQQYVLKPRAAVAKVNGDSIERQWYDKNVAYSQIVLQHDTQNLQSQYQALAANQKANAAATATANPSPNEAATPAPSETPQPAAAASPGAEASGTPAPAGSPVATPTPAPTFNPQEAATVAALSSQYSADQQRLSGIEQQTLDSLIDADIMRQNAAKLGISVSNDEVAAQAKRVTDQIGGDDALKKLLADAHLSQSDFNQVQYNAVLKDKYRAYFADHPDVAPTPSPTPIPSPTPAPTEAAGPVPPTPTPSPTPAPTPGADSLARWLEEQRTTGNISRASFPLPS